MYLSEIQFERLLYKKAMYFILEQDILVQKMQGLNIKPEYEVYIYIYLSKIDRNAVERKVRKLQS